MQNQKITIEVIETKEFHVAARGYNQHEVDEFLDRCADAVEELNKINNENERKMQVLAETVMDYRNQEDSIRSALISAQRMSEWAQFRLEGDALDSLAKK